ncbi:MAG: glycoside hydrolase family 97 catalytic domain-containing protein [Candidatus Limimorpha sp.]
MYQLAAPSRIGDSSWVKPGKVAWEWWNAWGLRNVGFEPGVNDATYEYYIDFASRYGIEYVILDEGWVVNRQADLFQVVPEINLPHLVGYANERNVGLVLWAGYAAMDKDMEKVCRHYSDMGIKGFKVDFMDRDDQKTVDFYYRMAETAARYHLLVDFHGAYKPTGMNCTYPNVLNVEGVFGLEQVKWSNDCDLVTYETTIPFIRIVAGPMDFTQGAMKNASQTHFKADYGVPMSQGTRCVSLPNMSFLKHLSACCAIARAITWRKRRACSVWRGFQRLGMKRWCWTARWENMPWLRGRKTSSGILVPLPIGRNATWFLTSHP